MSLALRLTPEQQAAVVLVSLEPDAAQPIADRLGPIGVQRVKTVLNGLAHVPREDLLAAFAVFLTELDTRVGGLQGGRGRAMSLLKSALGNGFESSMSFGADVQDAEMVTSVQTIWEKFANLEPQVISDYIAAQAPALGALMLDNLPRPKMAEVLSDLDDEKSVNLIAYLASDKQPRDAAVRAAEMMIEADLLTGTPDLSKDPRLEAVGEVLGTLPRGLREAALKRLDDADIDRAAAVRKALLSLDDIPTRLPTRGVQTIFREIEASILLPGLAAATQDAPEAADFLLGNISQRMADQYRENMAEIELKDRAASDKAVGALLREILSLNRRGMITLTEKPKDD